MAAAGSRGRLSHSSGTTRSRTVLVVAIGLLVAVIAVVVGLLAPRLGGDDGADRAAVLQRAEDFAVTYNTYDVADKDEYQARMRDLLTSGYYTEFARVTDAVFSALDSQQQRSGDARVLATAVDSIDDDTAVALVAVNAAISTSEDEAAVQRRFRWKVSFAREDGDWRVSQFESVVPVDAEVGAPEDGEGVLPGTEGGTTQDGEGADGSGEGDAGQDGGADE